MAKGMKGSVWAYQRKVLAEAKSFLTEHAKDVAGRRAVTEEQVKRAGGRLFTLK